MKRGIVVRGIVTLTLFGALIVSCGLEDSGAAPGDASAAGSGAGGVGGAGGAAGWPSVGGTAGTVTGGAGGSAGTGGVVGGAGGNDGGPDASGGSGGVSGGGGTGGITWTPMSIPGCKLWLDASSASSVQLSGTAVQIWKDQCDSHDAAGVANSKPQYVNGLLNGMPGVQFDGVDDYLEIGGGVTTAGAYHAFFVIQTSAPGGVAIWSNRGTLVGSSETPTFFGTYQQQPEVFQDKAVPQALFGATKLPAKAVVYELAMSASGRQLLVDGTWVATDFPLGNTTTSIPVGLIAADKVNGVYMSAAVFEVVFYDTEPSLSDAATVRSKLAAKWGL